MATKTIYYFTGTGNTARAVGIIQSALEQAGHQLHTELITPHTAPPDPGSYDVLLLSFPTYAWAPPVLVQKYIRRLKGGQAAGNRTKAAVCIIDGGGLLFTLVKIGLVIGGQWIGAALMGMVTPWAEKIPPLRRLMLTCFNKRFNRYTAEGFKARQHV